MLQTEALEEFLQASDIKDVYLKCAIPCHDQDKKWDRSSKKHRQKILKQADTSTMVSDHYSSDCFFARNMYMVDKTDVVEPVDTILAT